MWQWSNPEKQSAHREDENGFESCGINCEPLKSWLEEGNEPKSCAVAYGVKPEGWEN
jgi:hypothetical protein